MGTQNRHARMPLPPATVAPRPYPILWDTRARSLAAERRGYRDLLADASGAELTRALDALRPSVSVSYLALVTYRAALHEAVVTRHWTVEWSALDNRHHIY